MTNWCVFLPVGPDPAPHSDPEEVHVWKTHLGQAGEVLHEEQRRSRSHLRSPQRHHVSKPTNPEIMSTPLPDLSLPQISAHLHQSVRTTSSTSAAPVRPSTKRHTPILQILASEDGSRPWIIIFCLPSPIGSRSAEQTGGNAVRGWSLRGVT